MFGQMRSALGIPKSVDILVHIHSLPPDEQEPAMNKIRAIESAAMVSQTPQPGLSELMTYLETKGLPKGLPMGLPMGLLKNHLKDLQLGQKKLGS